MARSLQPSYPVLAETNLTKIENSDGTTKQTIFTADAVYGGAVLNMIATTDDTVDTQVNLWISDGTDDFPIAQIGVDAGAGTDDSTQPVVVIDESFLEGLLDEWGQLRIGKGKILKASMDSALSSGKTMYLTTTLGTYNDA